MELDTTVAYLLLGSNLGDREQLIEDAIDAVGEKLGTITLKSALYETAAWGNQDQPTFLNSAIALSTTLSAMALLNGVLAIEEELGRVRALKWGARLIDIDIIFYGNEIVNIDAQLQIPHPHMHKRRFVLVPLEEIASEVLHPVLNRTVSELLESLNDDLTVMKV